MAHSTQKQKQAIKKISVSNYMELFSISRHAVHRRIERFENKQISVNNIIGVERHGTKIILLEIDPNIKFEKKY